MVAKFAVEVNVAPPPLKEPEVAPSEFAVNTVSLSFGAAKVELQVAAQITLTQQMVFQKSLIMIKLIYLKMFLMV